MWIISLILFFIGAQLTDDVVAKCQVYSKGTQFYIHLGGGCLLGPHPWHMEVPRLQAESELQLNRSCTTARATPGPRPTEPGQGSNLQPHGYSSDAFPPCHSGNSHIHIFFFRVSPLIGYYTILSIVPGATKNTLNKFLGYI